MELFISGLISPSVVKCLGCNLFKTYLFIIACLRLPCRQQTVLMSPCLCLGDLWILWWIEPPHPTPSVSKGCRYCALMSSRLRALWDGIHQGAEFEKVDTGFEGFTSVFCYG